MRYEKISYTDGMDAMRDQMEEHFHEVPFGTFELALDIDHNAYLIAEQEGYLLCYIAYDEDKPVAYMGVIAGNMMKHIGNISAVADSYYVAPDYRKSGVFAKLLEFVEKDIATHGVRFFSLGQNVQFKDNADRLLLATGYQKMEILFTKEL